MPSVYLILLRLLCLSPHFGFRLPLLALPPGPMDLTSYQKLAPNAFLLPVGSEVISFGRGLEVLEELIEVVLCRWSFVGGSTDGGVLVGSHSLPFRSLRQGLLYFVGFAFLLAGSSIYLLRNEGGQLVEGDRLPRFGPVRHLFGPGGHPEAVG